MNGHIGTYAKLRRTAICVSILTIILTVSASSFAQRREYRAYWVDTFNTTLNNHNDVVAVVNNAKATNANAIFAQVRRRGDSWYLNSLEPKPDYVAIAAGFDPLADLIAVAHAEGIEVHAFVIMSAVWTKNPTFAPSATLGPPLSDDHVFNRHGWNKTTSSMRTGPDNWLTRSLAPYPTGVTFDGQRYGSDFWLDFGHPDAAAYSVDVLMHLVRNYDIDGLHLDRIRYPEFAVPAGQPAQTPTNGTNVGYNQVSVDRFNAKYNRSGMPPFSDNLWKQWRRDQVTNLVRRIYLNTVAVKPHVKVSAALIAFGGAPTCNAGADCKAIWESSFAAEAYWRVYQDWRGWTDEGILDLAIPMNYKREHIPAQEAQFNAWNEWTKNNKYDRTTLVGVGNFINSIEGSIRQVRRSLAPSLQGNTSDGVVFFSMATSNVFTNSNGTTPVTNPYSVPPNQLTPTRPFAQFALGLTTGRSGTTLFESSADHPGYEAIFANFVPVPILPWKAAPSKGHIMGFVRPSESTVIDTGVVTIRNLDTNDVRTATTDGGGFFGSVDLAPGRYIATAAHGTQTLYSCQAVVVAGRVAEANVGVENTPPVTTAAISPAANLNGWNNTNVELSLSTADSCSGVQSAEYSINDGPWLPQAGPISFTTDGIYTVRYRSVDLAGNAGSGSIIVRVDKTAPSGSISASPGEIWPPNGKLFDVTLSGSGSDNLSGLHSVTYVITDEYGETFTVAPHSLTGLTSWSDILKVRALRRGDDLDGRLYQIAATISDAAGNTTTANTQVVVVHDQRK